MGNTILELKNIVKTFPGVLACKWCPATASVAEQNGRDAELSGHLFL